MSMSGSLGEKIRKVIGGSQQFNLRFSNVVTPVLEAGDFIGDMDCDSIGVAVAGTGYALFTNASKNLSVLHGLNFDRASGTFTFISIGLLDAHGHQINLDKFATAKSTYVMGSSLDGSVSIKPIVIPPLWSLFAYVDTFGGAGVLTMYSYSRILPDGMTGGL